MFFLVVTVMMGNIPQLFNSDAELVGVHGCDSIDVQARLGCFLWWWRSHVVEIWCDNSNYDTGME